MRKQVDFHDFWGRVRGENERWDWKFVASKAEEKGADPQGGVQTTADSAAAEAASKTEPVAAQADAGATMVTQEEAPK